MKKKLTISDLDGFADICNESRYLVNGGYTESGTYCDGSTLKQEETEQRWSDVHDDANRMRETDIPSGSSGSNSK